MKGSKNMNTNTKKFTTQDVIDMGADLYDNYRFTREQIRMWLTILLNSGRTESFEVEPIFDLIVG
jgi:hypothetical protein